MNDLLLSGTLSALWVSLFSGLGGCLVFLKKDYSKKNIDFLLNIAAGVMLASSFFTLLAPAMHSMNNFQLGKTSGALLITLAVLVGFILVWSIHLILPHQHETSGVHGPKIAVSTSLLFIFAITIHKFPEGLAVGVAYAGEEYFNPKALAFGIALQNIPEGLMVAVSLVAINFSRVKAAFYAALTGLMQPIGAFVGILGTSFSQTIVPFGMALAGGCMIFVIINEIIPETVDKENEQRSSWGIFLGFLLMTYLSVVMG